jgi:hypothetical protein
VASPPDVRIPIPGPVKPFVDYWIARFFRGPSGDFERALGQLTPEQRAEFERIAPTTRELRRLTPVQQGRAEFRALRQAAKFVPSSPPPPTTGGSGSIGEVPGASPFPYQIGAELPGPLQSVLDGLRRQLLVGAAAKPQPKIPSKGPARRGRPRRSPPKPRTPRRPRVPKPPPPRPPPRPPRMPVPDTGPVRGPGLPVLILAKTIEATRRGMAEAVKRKMESQPIAKGPPTRGSPPGRPQPAVQPISQANADRQNLGKGPTTRPRISPVAPRSAPTPAPAIPRQRAFPPIAPGSPVPRIEVPGFPIPKPPSLPKPGFSFPDLLPYALPFLSPQARPALDLELEPRQRPAPTPGQTFQPSAEPQIVARGQPCACPSSSPRPRKKPKKNRQRKRCVTEDQARDLGIAKKLGLTRSQVAALG